jgi:hypothetical protein
MCENVTQNLLHSLVNCQLRIELTLSGKNDEWDLFGLHVRMLNAISSVIFNWSSSSLMMMMMS